MICSVDGCLKSNSNSIKTFKHDPHNASCQHLLTQSKQWTHTDSLYIINLKGVSNS